MRFSDFPFLKYLQILIGGVLIGNQIEYVLLSAAIALLVFLWLAFFLILHLHRSNSRLIQLSLIGYLLIFSFGISLTLLKKGLEPVQLEEKSWESYLAEVRQFDLKKPNSFENLLELKAVKDAGQWKAATGLILVYHQAPTPLLPGQLIKVKKIPARIAGPVNPQEFDYRSFLARKEVYFRQFIGKDFVIIDSTGLESSDFLVIRLRNHLANQLNSLLPDERSKQIAMALLLGQKQTLDRDLREGYVQAGVMHILAVSGLHVGIIYALFIGLLKPLKLSKKWARIYLLLVVVLIWVYAIITGLSPSVIRAATMFTLISLGQLRERKPSIFNVLAFSAMLMITLNPEVIFEVGFQLSYLAVVGIALIQPLILNWWLPKNAVLEYFWQLTSVSIAAQLATFPLTVFYFHVFPTYFLIGNLLIIPLAFLIMQVGVPLLAIGWIPVVGEVLGWTLSKLIVMQIYIVQFIQTLPWGKLDRLTISFPSMLLCWFLLVIWASWAQGKKKLLIYLSCGFLLIWSSSSLFQELVHPMEELLIYQGEKGQAFDYRFGKQLYAWNQGIEPASLSYLVDPNRIVSNQALIPLPMIGIPGVENQLQLFPSPIIFDEKTSEIYFLGPQPRKISVWSEGQWRAQATSDTLKLGNSAFRILF